jgi:uridine phosphorylase
MTLPLYKEKFDSNEITSPSRWAEYTTGLGLFSSFPTADLIFLTWQKSLFKRIKSRYAHISYAGLPGDVIFLDGTRSHEGGKGEIKPRIGVVGGFGMGAPAAVFMMEALGALGNRSFLGLGTAGGLLGEEEFLREESSHSLRIGDVILADRAFRDEGTGCHYQKEGELSRPSEKETEKLAHLLEAKDYSWHKGGLWTTDAVFRETRVEVESFLTKGVLAVDMESSALFACAAMRGYSMASLFTVSDILTPAGWNPGMHHRKVGDTLFRLFQDIARVD